MGEPGVPSASRRRAGLGSRLNGERTTQLLPVGVLDAAPSHGRPLARRVASVLVTAPRITIIGGGSYQWAPKLLVDLANTPSLRKSHVVIEDVDPKPV